MDYRLFRDNPTCSRGPIMKVCRLMREYVDRELHDDRDEERIVAASDKIAPRYACDADSFGNPMPAQ
jgi:hypothetical protein